MGDDAAIGTPDLSDLDRLVDLWIGLVRDQRAYGTRLRAGGNESNARSWLAGRMTFDGVRVARIDDDIVGFVTFELMRDQFDRIGEDGIIHNLFVRSSHRNRGIGNRLLSEAERILTDRGADRVRLEILRSNDRAADFYMEQGYEPYRTTLRKSLAENRTNQDGPQQE